MSSDEERLEEMLKAVMETESEEVPVPNLSTDELPEMPMEDFPDLPTDELPEIPLEDFPDLGSDELPEIPLEDFSGLQLEDATEMPTRDISRLSMEETAEIPVEDFSGLSVEETPDFPTEKPEESQRKEREINPLDLLAMSEAEIDKILENEAALGEMFSRRMENMEQPDPSNERDDLSDIQELLRMSDNHEQIEDTRTSKDTFFGSTDSDGEDMQDLLKKPSIGEEDSEDLDKKQAKENRQKKKEERKKKKEKKKEDSGEKKEGLGKKLATLLFDSDDEVEEENAGNGKGKGKSADAKEEEVKGKKKKEKKKKPPKKNEPDPKKAAKEKQQKAKNAEKAKKRAEKAEKAAMEKRAAKKLPKKKVFVWVLFCASIGIGILLINSVGMATIQLTEARNAFDDKDFKTAYTLLNGKKLSEEDQLLFRQSSAVLHLNHAMESYQNHLKLEKPVMALEDLLKGVSKYQELIQTGEIELVTPELTAEYQSILNILQVQYGLSEGGALELNALKSDFEYSLQLEALVNGERYQSQTEIEQQEEEAAQYLELEDMLPEEEEYLNDSSD